MASLNKDQLISKQKMEQAFKMLDLDGNGVISRNELKSIMGWTAIPEIVWRFIINEVDMNHDGEVIYFIILYSGQIQY